MMRLNATILLAFFTIFQSPRDAFAETGCDVQVLVTRPGETQRSTIFHELKQVPESKTTPDDTVIYEWDHYRITADYALSLETGLTGLQIIVRDKQANFSVGSSTEGSGRLSFTWSDYRSGGRSVLIKCGVQMDQQR